jgi:hypothetical protein
LLIDRMSALPVYHADNHPGGGGNGHGLDDQSIDDLLEFSFALWLAANPAKHGLDLMNLHIDRADVVEGFCQS